MRIILNNNLINLKVNTEAKMFFWSFESVLVTNESGCIITI